VPARPSGKGSVFVVCIRGKKLSLWAEVREREEDSALIRLRGSSVWGQL